MAKYGNWFENAQNVLRGICTGTETTYAASGAISLKDKSIVMNSVSAACELTLAAGLFLGQEIFASCSGNISACTITIANPVAAGADVITFTGGDAAILRYTTNGWAVVQGITVA